MLSRTFCRFWLILLLLGLGVGRVWADNALLPDLQKIVDRGTLVVAVIDRSLPPMVEIADDGVLGGFDIDLAKEIAAKLGVAPVFVKITGSQGEVVSAVAEGKADVGISYLQMNVAEGQRVYFTKPYLVQPITLFVNREKGIDFNRYCPSRSDIYNLGVVPNTIGILGKTTLTSIISELEPNYKLRQFDSFDTMMSAVSDGDVLASLQGEVEAKYFLSRNPAEAIRLKLCEVSGIKEKIGIAVRPDAQDLLRWLNLYLEIRGTVIDVDQVIFREKKVY